MSKVCHPRQFLFIQPVCLEKIFSFIDIQVLLYGIIPILIRVRNQVGPRGQQLSSSCQTDDELLFHCVLGSSDSDFQLDPTMIAKV
jgi:hypothetical protein